MIRFLALALISLFIHSVSFAQELVDFQLINSGEVIQEARDSANLDSANYEAAVTLLASIGTHDTNYAKALYLRAYYSYLDSSFTSCELYCDEGIETLEEYTADFYNMKGLSLRSQGHFEEAIAHYNKCIEKYPTNYLYYGNRGLCYKTIGKHQDAYDSYKEAIRKNPYFVNGYNTIGYYLGQSGHLAASTLAYHTGILINPSTNDAFSVISTIESTANNEHERLDSLQIKDDEIPDYFSRLDLMLTNRIALEDRYKVNSDFTYNIVKAIHILVTKLEAPESTSNFWDRYVIRNYYPIRQDELFEGYSYYFLQGIKGGAVEKTIQKNSNDLDNFKEWAGKNIVRNFRLDDPNANDTTYKRSYYKSDHLYGEGQHNNATGLDIGQWTYYHEGGSTMSEGSYNGEGKREGVWTWYHENGNIDETLEFKNGDRHGSYTMYDKYGIISQEYNFVDDKIDGIAYLYNPNGVKTDSISMKNGKRHGPSYSLYLNGQVDYMVTYEEGEAIGPVKGYYNNGYLSIEATYLNGRFDGDYVEYSKLEEGRILEKGMYEEGVAQGDWEYYHQNGALKKKVTYVDGVETGTITEYYPNGAIYSKKDLDESGKYNGTATYHDIDGIAYEEIDYKKGDIIAYRAKGEGGKVIEEFERKKKLLEFTGYHPIGIRRISGKFDKTGRSGEWVDYYGDLVNGRYSYEEGNLQGMYTEYFTSGMISSLQNYNEDVRDSTYASYFPNGKPYLLSYYNDGYREGPSIEFNWSGDTSEYITYHEGDIHGFYIDYAPGNKKRYKYDYHEGYLKHYTFYDTTGSVLFEKDITAEPIILKQFYPNGKLLSETSYQYGVLHGPNTFYDGHGNVTFKGQYDRGDRTGSWVWYHDGTDVIRSEGNYIYGDKHGKWNRYYEDGSLREIEHHVYGDAEGVDSVFFENGKLMVTSERKDGYLHGKRTNYNPSGNVILYRYYYESEIYAWGSPHHPKGADFKVRLPKGSGVIKANYATGKPAARLEYISGELDKDYIFYLENGKQFIYLHTDNGYINGSRKEYYKSGTLKKDEPEIWDKKHGVSKYYYPTGKLKKSVTFHFGNEHGETIHYTESGKKKRIEQWYDGNLLNAKNL